LSITSAPLRIEPEACGSCDPVDQGQGSPDLLLGDLEPLDVTPRRSRQGTHAHELDDRAQQVAVVGGRVEGEDDTPRPEHADRLPLVLDGVADDPDGRGRLAVALGLVEVVVPDAPVA